MAARPSFSQLAAKLLQQRTAGFAGGKGGAGGKGPNLGQAAGGGAGIVLLAIAGLTVNAAMFNGVFSFSLYSIRFPPVRVVELIPGPPVFFLSLSSFSRWRTSSYQIHSIEWCFGKGLL